ncbi:unnamed protein product, partial [Didymodactylos carnosus]
AWAQTNLGFFTTDYSLHDENSLSLKAFNHLERFPRELQLKSNDIEQYDRRLNIFVHGIPEKDGGITNDLIVDMRDSIQVNIKPTDISTSHGLGKKSTNMEFVTLRHEKRIIF